MHITILAIGSRGDVQPCIALGQGLRLTSGQSDLGRRPLSPADRADSTVVTTQPRRLMHDWLFDGLAEEYALSADWDNRWRTGGTLGDVIDEAHLSPQWVLEGIERFVRDRDARLARIQARLDGACEG